MNSHASPCPPIVAFAAAFILFTAVLPVSLARADEPAPEPPPPMGDVAPGAADAAPGAADAGAIPGAGGSFTPSPTGGATYRIPIAVPPGIAGMQPELALVYNSHAPNGLLGPGWALDGLTAITRCAATVAQDGFSGGVAYDANDRFCLSGQRLVAVSGVYGAPGTEYRTEVDAFVRVVSNGSAGNGPASFTVSTKSGQRMQFGATPDSRVQAQSRSALVWALNRIEDPSGNYVTITYLEDEAGGESRPLRIDYTGNGATGFAPTRSVVFTYGARAATDVRQLYVAGSRVTLPVVLRGITTYVGATVVRDYRLEYETAGAPARVRLARVTECAADGGCLPPTEIAWQAPGDAALTTAWSSPSPQNVETLTGDFDGDGRADLLQVWTTANKAQVLLSRGDGTFATAWTSPPAAGTGGFFWATGPLSTFVGDFNGDGMSDVLQIGIDNNVAQTLLAVGDGSFVTVWRSPTGGNDGWVMRAGLTHTLVNDVDGDGRADIVQIRADASWGQVLLSVGDGGAFRTAWTIPSGLVTKAAFAHSFLRDVNGDGRADIVQVRTDQHTGQVLLARSDGSFALGWTSPGSGDGWLVRAGLSQTMVEDLNGDGLADIMQIRTDGHWAQALLSRGDGTFTTVWTSPSSSADSGFLYRAGVARAFLGDFNGDRRVDLIQIQTDWHDARVLLGAGDGSFTAAWHSPSSGDGWVIRADTARTIVDDFNGDGLSDLVQHRPDTGTIQTLLAAGTPPDLVTSIRSPLGGVLSIAYKPMTDPSVHERGVGSVYPTTHRPVPAPVVASTRTSDGRGTTATLLYRYGGLRHDLRGRGSLGFAWRHVAEGAGGAQTTTWLHQSFPLVGLVASSALSDDAGRLFRHTGNLWSVVETSSATYFPRLEQTDTFECDGTPPCRHLSTSFEYDAFGNPTRTVSWGDVAAPDEIRDEYTEWMVDLERWLHRPARMVVYGGGQLLRERWVSYDVRGLPTREEARLAGDGGTAAPSVVVRAYNAYGNPTSVTDPRGCKTATTFETAHRTYPRTVSTCLGHTTTFAHDARWGVRTSETDPNGQKTTFAYDGFGRLTRITGPLDQASTYGTTTKEYLDLGDPILQRILTYRTVEHGTANVIWSEEAFDGIGRVYRSRSQGPGGAIVVRTVFDARGLVSKVSVPRSGTEGVAWTEFAYDALRRRTRVTKPDGTSVTTVFAPGTVTATDERGKTTRRRLDGFGRVTRVEEINGITSTYVTDYTYDATGALRTVTNHLGHVTALSYDRLGRKTRLVDPNLGTWTYAYDLGGLLTRQTDAKRQTITFEYDAQGRVRFKRYPDGRQIEWTYDDPGVPFAAGRLTRVVDLAATTSFRYDALGRVTGTDRLLDGATYTLTRTYDALGRVTSERFPDGDVATYGFNAAGWLQKVGNAFNSEAYIRGITYNARGQRTEVRYANGVTSTLAYFDAAGDALSFRLKSIVTTGPQGAVQDLAYAYDPSGHVTRITDGLGTAGRTFTYDARRRLTSAAGTFGPRQAAVAESYTYDALGNFRTRNGVAYAYADPRHPSAVTARSDGATYDYDLNGNTLNGAGRAMAWDADNRLVAVTIQGGATAELAYDHAGERVRKVVNGTRVTRYPFPGYEIDATGIIIKRFAGVAKRPGDQKLFYHDDHLGSVHVVTDAGGARVQLVEYDPWGVVSRSEGTAEPTRRFTGQTLDPETGLMYYGGRYYDPSLGRFVSPDPFVPEPANPQALNRYTYVVNNPANAIDPSGFSFWDDIGEFFEEVFEFKLSVDRYVLPIATGIVVGYYTGCVPCAAAVAASVSSALNTAYAGGSLEDIVLASAVGGAVGFVAGAAGGVVGGAIGGTTGTIVGAAVSGATSGGLNAAIYGGDVVESAAYGAMLSAVTAAALYGGYSAYDTMAAPETATQCSADCVEVTPGAHTIGNRESRISPYHKLIRMRDVDGSDLRFSELVKDGSGNIDIATGPQDQMSKGTQQALETGRVVWGRSSIVSRSALSMSQELYSLRGEPYRWYSRNSNWYVNSVLERLGADFIVPRVWAPAFGRP